MTLSKIAQVILRNQGNQIDEKNMTDAYHKYRLALNDHERMEAITLIEIEISKVKDWMDLKGYRKSDQFESRYNYLKRLAKDLKII
jgi:hypothetical protein